MERKLSDAQKATAEWKKQLRHGSRGDIDAASRTAREAVAQEKGIKPSRE